MIRARTTILFGRLSLILAAVSPALGCVQPAHTRHDWINTSATAIRIENRYLSDMNIYVVRNGARYRLGMVSSLTEESFYMPAAINLDADIEFVAVPNVDGTSYRSEPIAMRMGDVLALTIQPGGNLSTFFLKH